MKRIILSVFLSAGIITATNAQSAQYNDAMQQQVSTLDSSGTFSQPVMLQKANTFERIAAAEQTQWMPYYYAGYCQVMLAFLEKDKGKVDEIVDKAALNVDKAEALSANNAEILCLKSLIASARIGVDPQNRGMKYGMEAGALLAQAKKINPDNPRIYMLEGQALLYTPEQFGGSKARAKQTFEVALQKFAAFKPESSIAPHWGEPYTKQLLALSQQ
jgi:hypothetical protein